jgi:hypothetical protein
MAWLASSEGSCMRCRAPIDAAHGGDGKPVACFHLGTFTARLCEDHAQMLMQELEAVFEDLWQKNKTP